MIDPTDPQLAAINAVLAGDPTLELLGQFGLDLSSAPTIEVSRESGAPLNSWLDFDADTLTFSGMPPSEYVGAVPVRIDLQGGTLPEMSIITEVVVDETFTVLDENSDVSIQTLPERLNITAPEDFNGSFAFTYDAKDEKGGESDDPANIVFNVRATREAAQANDDGFSLFENGNVTFTVADLMTNDRDDDGDALRVVGFGTPVNGTLTITLGTVEIDGPDGLTPLVGGTWSVALADGSDLPDWMAVDAVTGTVTGQIPLDVTGDYALRFSNTNGISTQSEVVEASFDGNAGASVTYAPTPSFAGEERVTYSLTDDAEGIVLGDMVFDVISLLDPPVAGTDEVDVFEDSFVVIDPADLLANDNDVDGDPIRFIGVGEAINGTVRFVGGEVLFTPTRDFEGAARFEYTITDDVHGENTGLVEVNVISTNQTPEAVTDVFVTQEDVPFEITIADLLANDIDADGDEITFQSISSVAGNGRLLELPDGRYQFVPDENVTGEVNFQYSITDGRRSDRGIITFDIQPINDAPIANTDGHFVGTQDEEFRIDFADLLFNDRDVEGDAFSIVEVFDGDNGTVYQDGDQAVFQGRQGYFGDGGFFYRVTDEHGATNTGYVTVLVMPLFDVPVAVSDAGYEMVEDTYLDIDPDDLMANDEIPLGSEVIFLGLEMTGQNRFNGTVTELDNGLWRLTTAQDFFGEIHLRYALTNETGFEVPTTVTIDVLGTSDAPVAQDDAFTLTEDTSLTIFVTELTDNDSDADRQAIVITRILGSENVTAELTVDGQVIITPDAGFNGEGWFEYELKDSGGDATTGRVNVTVEAENDAPVLGRLGTLFAVEEEELSIVLPAGIASDPDGDALIVDMRGPEGTALPAWLSFEPATGTLTGTPPADFNGDVALELAASDGLIETVRKVTLRVVEAPSDAPVITSGGGAPVAELNVTENQRAVTQITATDPTNDTLAYNIQGGADAAFFEIGQNTGALTFTRIADFELPTDIDDDNLYEVTVSVTDGTHTVEQSLRVTVTDQVEILTGETINGTTIGENISPSSTPLADLSDLIYGLGGDDTIAGGAGNDTLRGNAGADVILGGLGDDGIGGGTGVDLVTYEGMGHEYSITLHENGLLDVTSDADADRGTDLLVGVEQLDFEGSRFDGPIIIAETVFDSADAYDWTLEANSRDSAGDLLRTYQVLDDGREFEKLYAATGSTENWIDTSGLFIWSSTLFTLNLAGEILTKEVLYDDGRISHTIYDNEGQGETTSADPENVYSWESVVTTLNEEGVRTGEVRTFDNGRVATSSFEEGILTQTVSEDAGNIAIWNTATQLYSANGEVAGRVFNYDDGRTRTVTFEEGVATGFMTEDPGNAYSWESVIITVNTEGVTTGEVKTYDNGRVATSNFADGILTQTVSEDASGISIWETSTQFYDVNGEVIEKLFTYDNGRVRTVTFEDGVETGSVTLDPEDAYSWESVAATVNAEGIITGEVKTYDNGWVDTSSFEGGVLTQTISQDLAGISIWETSTKFFNAIGELTGKFVVYDNGRELTAEYAAGALSHSEMLDTDDAFIWTERVNDYDANGDLDAARVVFDDGRIQDSEYIAGVESRQLFTDADNAYDWASQETLFDEVGNKVSLTTIFDDGTADTFIF